MTRLPTILFLIIVLIQCQTKDDSLNGHYTSVSQPTADTYETLDIVDSLVLINKNLVFLDQRDTIVIDTKANSFVRSTRAMFPIYDFKAVNDTIELHFEHDAGNDKIKFVKRSHSIQEDYFSTSNIEMKLIEYDRGELIHASNFNLKNLSIGPLKKGAEWMSNGKDSIYIEFENYVSLENNELQELADKLIEDNDDKLILCLNFDKRVPQSMAKDIRENLCKMLGDIRMTESRNRNNEIVYLK